MVKYHTIAQNTKNKTDWLTMVVRYRLRWVWRENSPTQLYLLLEKWEYNLGNVLYFIIYQLLVAKIQKMSILTKCLLTEDNDD